jgi:hypothetical protein
MNEASLLFKFDVNVNSSHQGWYAEFLLKIDLELLFSKNRSKIKVEDQSYIFAYQNSQIKMRGSVTML